MKDDSMKHYDHKKCCPNTKRMRLLTFATFLLGSGVILILGNMGIIDNKIFKYIFSWQSLLIALGIINLAGGARSHWFGSFVLIMVGSLFLIDELYTLETGVTNIIWPLLLIIIGIAIMIKVFIPKKYKNRKEEYNVISEENSSEDYINISKVFSSLDLNLRSENFQGGQISVVFGGGEIDLRSAKLSEGTSILKVECVFGGIKLFVPKTWDVNIESSGVFGGFSDERRYILNDEVDKTRKLIIKAEAVFGGGEISN